jgi:hypothetical protein
MDQFDLVVERTVLRRHEQRQFLCYVYAFFACGLDHERLDAGIRANTQCEFTAGYFDIIRPNHAEKPKANG